MKFTSKVVEIEAKQFLGNNYDEIYEFTAGKFEPVLPEAQKGDGIIARVFDELHETWVGVKQDQWIIKGLQGEFYPCAPDVFEAKYEISMTALKGLHYLDGTAFTDQNETAISYHGTLYRETCGVEVYRNADGYISTCAKFKDHRSVEHEDIEGHKSCGCVNCRDALGFTNSV